MGPGLQEGLFPSTAPLPRPFIPPPGQMFPELVIGQPFRQDPRFIIQGFTFDEVTGFVTIRLLNPDTRETRITVTRFDPPEMPAAPLGPPASSFGPGDPGFPISMDPRPVGPEF